MDKHGLEQRGLEQRGLDKHGPEQRGPDRRMAWSRRAVLAGGVLLLIAVGGTTVLVTHRGAPPINAQWSDPTTRAASAGPTGPSASVTPNATTTSTTAKTTGPVPLPVPGGCVPAPSRCGFPDATDTGVPAGTTLTPKSGDMKVTQAGTVIDGINLNGCIRVEAPHVTIRDSKVSCQGPYGIFSYEQDYSGGGLLIQDVEVDCERTQATGIASYGFTAVRVKVHGCENGFAIDNTATVQDSYVYDLFIGNGGHTDGIQMGGADNVIRHNTILNEYDGGTSAIITSPTGMSHVTITDNLMAGGAYTLYCPRDSSSGVVVTDNRFSKAYSPKGGAYGPWTYCDNVAEQHGNVWDADSKPLPL
jgi:hypothetical protein